MEASGEAGEAKSLLSIQRKVKGESEGAKEKDSIPVGKEEGEGDEPPNARMRFSAFNLANTIVGGGILSLPFAMALSGLGLGLLFLFAIYLYGLFCLSILVESAELSGLSTRASFRGLAFHCFGKAGTWISDLCIIISCFGVMCSYLVIIADMLQPMISNISSMSDFNIRATIIACSMVILIPLSSLRHMNPLRLTSVVAVVAAGYTVLLVFIKACLEMATPQFKQCEGSEEGCVRWAIWDVAILRAIPIISLAFTCQFNFFTIYNELSNPSPRRMGKVSFRAMTFCLFLYGIMGTFGYLNFRASTEGNILLNYGPEDIAVIFARLAIAIEITFSYPILAHPCIGTFDDLFIKKPFTFRRRIIEAIAFSVVALLVAIFVKDVSFIFSLTGATTSNMISFILPASFYLQLTRDSSWLSGKKFLALSMLVMGVFFLVASTAVILIDS